MADLIVEQEVRSPMLPESELPDHLTAALAVFDQAMRSREDRGPVLGRPPIPPPLPPVPPRVDVADLAALAHAAQERLEASRAAADDAFLTVADGIRARRAGARKPPPPVHRGPLAAHEVPDHEHHAIVQRAIELKATNRMTWDAIAERLQMPGDTRQQQARNLRRWRRDYARLRARETN